MHTGCMGTWLFAGGVVHRESWRITAAAWPEVREVQLFRLGGRPDAPEPFAARLRAAAAAAGVPVVERSRFPALGRRAA